MQEVDTFLLGRKTYVIHANAFEPMKPGDPFGDLMNAPAKYVVSKTLEKPIWRNTTIIRDNVVEAVRRLKAAPGKNIITDGSHELVHLLHKIGDFASLSQIPAALRNVSQTLAGVPTVWLHMDCDVLDDRVMPAVDYRVRMGSHRTSSFRCCAVSGRISHSPE